MKICEICGSIFFGCGLILGQGVCYALSADPNLSASDPNRPAFGSTFSHPDPNTSSLSNSSIPGTLAMNWLYQGKKSPTPVVGQENVTFRTEIYPWPYWSYDRDGHFVGPWLYHPWYGYDYWKRYRDDSRWWYRDDFTYPLNYAEVQMKLDAQTTFHFGGYFLSDPLNN